MSIGLWLAYCKEANCDEDSRSSVVSGPRSQTTWLLVVVSRDRTLPMTKYRCIDAARLLLVHTRAEAIKASASFGRRGLAGAFAGSCVRPRMLQEIDAPKVAAEATSAASAPLRRDGEDDPELWSEHGVRLPRKLGPWSRALSAWKAGAGSRDPGSCRHGSISPAPSQNQ